MATTPSPSPAGTPSGPPFVGREEELTAVAHALERPGALVTLWGPPGAGKSRLLEELALRSPTRIRIVPATDADEASLVTRVCRALGLPDRTRGRLAVLTEALRRVAVAGEVVALDELDALAPRVAAPLADLRAAIPELRLVVTSREVLGIPGEDVHRLGALSPADAVALLVSRAARLWYTPAAADWADLSQLAERLDRLPLTLELLADWLAVLGPRGLLDQLDADERPSVGHGSPLERAIARSWYSLAPGAQRALAAFSVFRGGFEMGGARAVCEETPARTLDLLQALIAKSLVHVTHTTGRTRFHLLMSVREFAARRLEALGGTTDAARAHAAYYARAMAKWLGQLDGDAPAEGMAAMRQERDNLLVAARDGSLRDRATLVIGLGRFLTVDGPVDRLGELLDAVDREAKGEASLPQEVRYVLQVMRAEWRRQSDDLDAAVALAAAIPDDAPAEVRVRARITLGLAAFVGGDLEGAGAEVERALALASSGPEGPFLCRALLLATNVAAAAEDPATASAHCERAIEVASRHRWQREAGALEVVLGTVRVDQGRTADAELLLESATRRVPAGLDHLYDEHATILAAMIAHRRWRLQQAADLYLHAAELTRDLGGGTWHAAIHDGYAGMALVGLGRERDAEAPVSRALAGIREVGDRRYEALFEAYLASIQATPAAGATSRLEQARTHVEHARALASASGDEGFAAAVDYQVARVLHAEGLAAAAAGRAEDAARLQRAHRQLALETDARARDTGGRIRPFEAFVSRRIYEAALGKAQPVDEAPREALVIGPAYTWFRPPLGEVADLARKPLLRGILRALVEAGLVERHLDRDALRRAGWGDERMSASTAGNRLRVALAGLRKLGLAEILHRDRGGWWLALEVPVFFADDGDRPTEA